MGSLLQFFGDKSTTDEITQKRAILHPLFCACASCASASAYVCAPMCTFSTCVYISQMWSHGVYIHMSACACTCTCTYIYVTILKDEFLNEKITFVLLYRFHTYSRPAWSLKKKFNSFCLFSPTTASGLWLCMATFWPVQ